MGVLFDDDTYSKLVQITDREEISLSEYVRAVVEEKLENIEMEGPSGQKLLLMPKKLLSP